MRTPISLAVFSLALVGCGGGNPVHRLEDQFISTAAAVCDACPSGGTPAECRAAADAANPFDDPEWVCQREVYDRYPNQLGPYYDCIVRATDEWGRCVRGRLSSCPPDIVSCNEAQNAAIRACPIPDSVEAASAVAACFR